MRDLSLNTKSSTTNKNTSTTSKQTTVNKTTTEESELVQYKGYYIEVDNEPAKEYKLSKEKELYKEYEKEESSSSTSGERWGKEKYEDNSPDKVFEKFQKRIGRSPEQILRYSFGGNPLWISQFLPKPEDIPSCPHCHSPRIFEMQLLPTIVTLGLKFNKKTSESIEFGVVSVYSCSNSCPFSEYSTESVFVQPAV